ncbi:MAG: restriction endonuclease subunit S [Desulfobulbaceae bacterium]|nr:restriction endonuclease subunit S [Desulfobulbaceae bacterium]
MKLKYDIPKEWKYVKLKNLVTQAIKNGYSPNCPEESNGSWILSLGNLTENGFDPSQAKPAPKEDNKVKDFLLEPGDFLISRSNTLDKVGRTMLFRGEIENCSYPDLLMRFRVDETRVLNTFFEIYLRSSIVRKYIQSCASGTSNTMVKINKTVVEKIPVVLPPYPEQRAIADLLSTWDKAIEKTERLIQTKGKRLNALYQSYFRADSSTTKSWEPVKVGKFVTPRNEKAVPSEDQPLYSLTIENGVTEKTERYNREFLVKDTGNKTYKVVHPGDIVFNPANLRWGAIARSTVDHRVVLSPIYEVLQIKDNAIDPDFLTHALTCPRQIAIYATKTEGTLIERMAVKLDAFLLLKIRVPSSISEQKEIAKTLSNAQQEIDLLKQLTDKYKNQKRGLMQKMLTGEWHVKPEIVNQYMEA